MTTHKEAMREKITDICFNNGGVTKPMVDQLEALFDAALDKAVREARIEELERLVSYNRNAPTDDYETWGKKVLNYLKSRLANLKKGK